MISQHQIYPQFFLLTSSSVIFYNYQFNNMSIKNRQKAYKLASSLSTEADSAQEYREDEKPNKKKNALKAKTELCKNFSEKGSCPYGKKCRFAHGSHQLVEVRVKDCYRKKRCNNFWTLGYCAYGVRCQFSHQDSDWSRWAVMIGISSLHVEKVEVVDRLCSQLLNILSFY